MLGANLNAAENDLELLIFLGHRLMGMCLYQLAVILLRAGTVHGWHYSHLQLSFNFSFRDKLNEIVQS